MRLILLMTISLSIGAWAAWRTHTMFVEAGQTLEQELHYAPSPQ